MKKLLLNIISILFLSTTAASAATTLEAELISVSTSVTSFADHDEGLFTVRIKLTATGGDAYITSHPLSPSGFFMSVERNGFPSGSTYLTAVDNISSSVNIILEGESHVFQTTTLVEPNLTGLYRVGIAEIEWQGESSSVGSTYGTLNLDSSYRTSYVSLRAAPIPEPSRIMFLGLGIITMAFRRRK